MEVEFSKHAIDQIKIRSSITKQMVYECLQNSDDVLSSYRDRELYIKRINNGLLEVVAVKEDNKLIVITAYILED